jgi:SAM-dependent methyltransferase
MPELSDVYPEQYFRRRRRYRGPYLQFARAVEETWHPESLLDVGCGVGYLLEHFAGRIPVLGVEGSPGALRLQAPEVRRRCVRRDLTEEEPSQVALALEFAVSIEVAEHIPPEGEDAFLRWFAGARRVFLTAAPPGQGGRHHVNEQPPEYWQERLAALGLAPRPGPTDAWRKLARSRTPGCPWVVRNAMFFVREDS